MKVDFEKDLGEALQYQLSDFQVRLAKKEKLHDGLLDYLTILKKLVRPIPRVVMFNPELLQDLEQHPKRKEILHLKNLFEKGNDVNLFQSKRLFQSNFHDHLLYEWNIFHFHLSLEKDRKGQFVKQVKQLLFVYIAENQVIFLGTDNHEPGTFGDTKWQEVLYDHFPEILDILLISVKS